ncbi:hypothetical protein [Frondihabitans cladoniiphilus]|uniref:Phage holin family protein n=1 Tax=Frondihabitans cladoniiphilus TaxID=715785 RepID=A0ABP8W9Y7_9MICO
MTDTTMSFAVTARSSMADLVADVEDARSAAGRRLARLQERRRERLSTILGVSAFGAAAGSALFFAQMLLTLH